MHEDQEKHAKIGQFLQSGRHLLEEASQTFGRTLRSEEYWLFGVGLAALTLGHLNSQPYAVDRFDFLLEELGYQGVKGDWWGRFVTEISTMGSAGMLWPVFERKSSGQIEPTGCRVRADFDGTDAYWLALSHVAGALVRNTKDQESIEELAEIIVTLIEDGRTPVLEEALLEIFGTFKGADHTGWGAADDQIP